MVVVPLIQAILRLCYKWTTSILKKKNSSIPTVSQKNFHETCSTFMYHLQLLGINVKHCFDWLDMRKCFLVGSQVLPDYRVSPLTFFTSFFTVSTSPEETSFFSGCVRLFSFFFFLYKTLSCTYSAYMKDLLVVRNNYFPKTYR